MAIEKLDSSFSLNPDILKILSDNKRASSINETINISVAVFLFTERAITLARAAELANKNLGDFVNLLIKHNIPWNEYTDEHKQTDESTLNYIKGVAENDKSNV